MPDTPNRRVLALVAIGLLVVAIDQYSKHLVRLNIPPNASWDPIPGIGHLITFTHVHNTGAAFGLLSDPRWANPVLALVAVVVIALILLHYRQLAGGSWLLAVALGLQLGGAAGNLVDRLAREQVTDFIDLHFWPVFNVADSALVIGTALLGYYALRREPAPRETPDEAREAQVQAEDAPLS